MFKNLTLAIVMATAAPLCLAQEAKKEEPKKIADNSFLIEEAYNQEEGVVQHIQTFLYNRNSKDWFYTFTQEWPFHTQTTQLSYTIPYTKLSEGSFKGIGDIALNYRWQAIMNDDVAFSPRLSVLVPSGDYKKGLGAGATGYQVNLPLSVELGDRIVTHWNLGGTWTPRAREAGGSRANTFATSYGASVIYLLSENFNLMLEAVRTRADVVQPGGGKLRETTTIINPGMRFAVNFPGDLQMVGGLSYPKGVGSSSDIKGWFAYLSFEHPFK